MKKYVFTLLTLANMGLIFYFSSQNGEQSTMTSAWFLQFLPFSMFVVRKLAHFTIYALLGFNTFYMYRCYGLKKHGILAFITCVLYACSDEWHQSFVSGRSPQIRDVCIDSLGALSLITLNYYWLRLKHRQN